MSKDYSITLKDVFNAFDRLFSNILDENNKNNAKEEYNENVDVENKKVTSEDDGYIHKLNIKLCESDPIEVKEMKTKVCEILDKYLFECRCYNPSRIECKIQIQFNEITSFDAKMCFDLHYDTIDDTFKGTLVIVNLKDETEYEESEVVYDAFKQSFVIESKCIAKEDETCNNSCTCDEDEKGVEVKETSMFGKCSAERAESLKEPDDDCVNCKGFSQCWLNYPECEEKLVYTPEGEEAWEDCHSGCCDECNESECKCCNEEYSDSMNDILYEASKSTYSSRLYDKLNSNKEEQESSLTEKIIEVLYTILNADSYAPVYSEKGEIIAVAIPTALIANVGIQYNYAIPSNFYDFMNKFYLCKAIEKEFGFTCVGFAPNNGEISLVCHLK